MIIQNAIQQQKEVFRLQTTLAFHYIPFILTITIRCEIDTSLCSCRSALHAQRALPLIIAPSLVIPRYRTRSARHAAPNSK